MRYALCVIVFVVTAAMVTPVKASPEEVMPMVEEVHESALRKVFKAVDAFLSKVNNNEAIKKEKQQWKTENAYGIGVRG